MWITDHYRVQDWTALEQALSGEADVEGSREDGWSRVFAGKDGLQCRSVAIDSGKQPDRIEVVYRHSEICRSRSPRPQKRES